MTEPRPNDEALSASATPPPADPANTGGPNGALFPKAPATTPGTVVDISTFASRPLEDLSVEQLLRAAPRMNVGERVTPALGGLPLQAKLGQGGMGAVYYGVHPRLHLEVAVKVLAPHLSFQSSSAVERFFREARTAARVKSAHLVTVLDVNEEQGLHFLVMEFIRGISAGAYLRQTVAQGACGVPETVALDICLAAVQGLAAAHEEGIIHRDIKPDNILIPTSKDGRSLRFGKTKLADLGLARGEHSEQGLTGSQVALGTPGYMAPEQAEDTNLTGKPADIFSLGATLYCLLAGRAPFTGTSFIKVLMATAHEPHPPISTVRPDLSAQTVALIDRCLSKAPDARPQDAMALLEELRACRAAFGTVAPVSGSDSAMAPTLIRSPNTPPPPPPPQPSGTPPSAGTWASAPPSSQPGSVPAAAGPATPAFQTASVPVAPAPPRRRRWVAVILVFLVLLLAGGGLAGWVVVKGRKVRRSVTHLVEQLEPTRQADEAEVAAAIARIEDFQRTFRGSNEWLRPATTLLSDLKDRKEELSDRKGEFDKLVEQARKRAEDRPRDALESLDHAEDLGAANADKAWADLTTDRRTELVELRKQIEQRIAEMAKAENAARHRQDFALGYQAGAGHFSRGEVTEAVQVLTKALGQLGNLEHVARSDAAAMLAKAKNEVEQRERAAEQLNRADQHLRDGQLDAAAALYRQARETWPENPEIDRVEAGLKTVADQFHAQRIAEGRKALVDRNWTAAERAFLAALKDRPGDPNATAGLQEARRHSQDSSYSQTMEEGYRALQQHKWNDAGQAFQKALGVRKDDPAALQGIRDAQTRAREELFQQLLTSGREAVTAGAWDRAAALYKEALNLKQGDATALQGLQRAKLRRVVRFSPSRVMEGYAKLRGLRERAEAQLAPLIRQREADRAEVARLSRMGRPPGRKRLFDNLRHLKQLNEARERLNQSSTRLQQESDRLKLTGTREALCDLTNAATELARRQSYYLLLQFESASEVNTHTFQRLGRYESATTPEQMLAAYRRNKIVAAPPTFDPATTLIPGADLGKTLAGAEDVTPLLIRVLNESQRRGPLKKP